jgi:hypothetical protein
VVENLDHFVVEHKAFFGFLGGYEFREVLKDLLDGNCDIDGLKFGLLIVKDGFDALLDLLEGDRFFMREGLRLAHWSDN